MKTYVAMDVRMDAAGGMLPLRLYWEDGRRFDVQSVLDVRRAASLKAGGTGLRYTCLINGKVVYLFFEDPRWFVDAKK